MVAPLATYGARLLSPFYPDLLFRIDDAPRTLYLTFDDGPTPSTPDLLAELERYDARATFFLQGRYAREMPDLTRTHVEAGHVVGNHTYAHPDAWRTPEDVVLDELDQTQTLLTDLTDRPVRWMRPPYGRFTRGMRDWCRTHDTRLVMWDTMPADYRPGARSDDVVRHVLATVRPGSIVVLHDNPRVFPVMFAAVRRLLPTLAAEGWRFEALPAPASSS